MTPTVDITVESGDWEQVDGLASLVEAAISAATRLSAVKPRADAEVSLMFCDDATIRSLNRDWRKINKPTNVLSFSAPGKLARRPLLGDIAVAFETLQAEAAAEGKTMRDHLTHLVVHGYLHLLGMDHETAAGAEEMEQAERLILAELGVSDPYAGAALLEVQGPR